MSKRDLVGVVGITLVLTAGCGDGMTREEAWIQSAKEHLSATLSKPVGELEVVEFEEVVFPDTSFGCPEPGMNYAQSLQEGYRLILGAEGESGSHPIRLCPSRRG